MSFIYTPTSGTSLPKVTRTSNVQLTASNLSNFVQITSGTFTQTFDSCSSLGNGWFAYIENLGTGNITLDPFGTETIDGLTSFIMYPGETRLIQCDGSNLISVVLNAFFVTYTASDTFTKPPGYAAFGFDVIGGGAGGGRGAPSATGYPGGGGGGRFINQISASAFGATETITVGAGGAGATVNNTGGGAGGTSSIGSIVSLVPGGFYEGGALVEAHTTSLSQGSFGWAGAVSTTSGNDGRMAEFGGASSGYGSFGANANAGGSSIRGGGGGGGGAGDGALANRSGGRGGRSGSWTAGGGGSSGSAQAGGNGADGNFIICGAGGGGGGTTAAGNGLVGGNGGIPGGGGGAGGAGGFTAANGGNGGRGEVRIWGIV